MNPLSNPDHARTIISVANSKRNRTILENSPLLQKYIKEWKEVPDEEEIHITALTKEVHLLGKHLISSGMCYGYVNRK